MNTQPSTAQTFIALLGYAFALLIGIILFVIVVEYDPVGKIAKSSLEPSEAMIIQEGETLSAYLNTDNTSVAYDVIRPESLKGQKLPTTAYGYVDRIHQQFTPELALPHAPRDFYDLIGPLIILLICIAMISKDPRITYIDVMSNHD